MIYEDLSVICERKKKHLGILSFGTDGGVIYWGGGDIWGEACLRGSQELGFDHIDFRKPIRYLDSSLEISVGSQTYKSRTQGAQGVGGARNKNLQGISVWQVFKEQGEMAQRVNKI